MARFSSERSAWTSILVSPASFTTDSAIELTQSLETDRPPLGFISVEAYTSAPGRRLANYEQGSIHHSNIIKLSQTCMLENSKNTEILGRKPPFTSLRTPVRERLHRALSLLSGFMVGQGALQGANIFIGLFLMRV